MAKPWRMRCQRSCGVMVRSTSATCGRGSTVVLGPSNLPAGAAAGAAGVAGGLAAVGGRDDGVGDSELAGGAAGCVSLSGVDGVPAQAATSAGRRRTRSGRLKTG